jgi:hypothetical protein
LRENEKKMLLAAARESIRSHLTGETPTYPEPSPVLLNKCGAFVTLHRAGKLRGCIGHIIGIKPLFEAVIDLARSSAFHDPRFPPLRLEEFPEIDLEISVLTPLKKIDSPDEVVVGTHGVYLESGSHSGVLLPQVPIEQGWDREEYLRHLCYKAGLPPDCLDRPGTRLSTFEALVFGEKD